MIAAVTITSAGSINYWGKKRNPSLCRVPAVALGTVSQQHWGGYVAPSRGHARSERWLQQDCRPPRLSVALPSWDAQCQASVWLRDCAQVPKELLGDALCSPKAATSGAFMVPGRQEHPCAAGSQPQAFSSFAAGGDETSLQQHLGRTPSGRQHAPAAATLRRCRQRGLPGPKRCVPGSRVPPPRQGTRGPHFPVHSSLSQGCPGVWGGPSNTWEHAGRNKATLAPRAEQYHIFTVKNMPRTQAERQHRKQLTQQTFHPTKPCFSIQTWFVPPLFNTTRMLREKGYEKVSEEACASNLNKSK